MAEYKHFDGEDFVTFDILSVNAEKKEVEVAITNRGDSHGGGCPFLNQREKRLFS